MGTTTDIRELRKKAKDLVMIAGYKDTVVWFWRNASPSNEMVGIINRVEDLFGKIQSSKLPQDSVEIIRVGQQIHDFAKKGVEITKDGTPLNIMIREFIDVLGEENV